MNDMLYEIDGNMGKTLQVYEDRCVISSKTSLKSALFGNMLNGDKEFYYKDLTSVQFKNLGMTTGFLQFEFAGAQGGNSNFVSENSFTFSANFGSEKHKQLKEKMPEVYEDIRKRIHDAKTSQAAPAAAAISPAEEIKKLKELMDMGVITSEEFETKKKQLLGL